MSDRPLPGHAALAPEDVADAKRGRPASDLSGYGTSRGLDWLDTTPGAGFGMAMPGIPGYNFNVLRGREQGWREWVLFHEVLPWPTSGRGQPLGGEGRRFHGLHYAQKGWWKWSPRELLTDIPVVGEFLHAGTEEQLRAVGVPCTVVAVQLPEAAWVRDFKLEPSGKLTPLEGDADPGLNVDALLEPLGGWSRQPFFELVLRKGALIARRNGFVDEPAELDRLVATALRAAAILADLAAGDPQPFDAPLPAPDWPATGYSASGRFPPEAWRTALRALAADVRMELEDPWAYMRAFPQQPVPGRAFAVLRDAERRLVLHTERDLGTHNVGRTALVSATDAPDRPRERRDGIDSAVRGGLHAAWIYRSGTKMGDPGDLKALAAGAAARP